MVCEKCEKKLGTVITPDTWKDGARNTTESGGRKLNENKALTSKKARNPRNPSSHHLISLLPFTTEVLKSLIETRVKGPFYLEELGICAMCGKKVLDTKNYKQTSV
ncbi:cysteine-rich PDZ-binding protein [Echinops telfairi]|uniref:Cysteine-rich PDZ-binding protein n=1 Tax=Echinops telfairi TaxID=9371 RepID=A0AC55CRK5_ECHTE|nr:cysteine-rich PDZ-binding protein [Echinops telfairi]